MIIFKAHFKFFMWSFKDNNIEANILDLNGNIIGQLDVLPGNTDAVSVNAPDSFIVNVPHWVRGKFCITLYKRVLG